MTETDPLPAATDFYCKYKLMIEQYIKSRVKKNPNFKIIVFRPATICGLSPRMRLELLPNHFTYLAIAKGLLRVSELNAYRAAIDMKDLIAGYFKVIQKGSWKKLIYNIGHFNMSKKDFATGIQAVIKCELGTITDIGDLRNLQIDTTRFDREFNFKPTVSYKKTIEQLARWIKKHLTEIEKSNFAGIINMSLAKWKEII
jgi:nucleoside-diphosphate-sugar epimerase